jgi:hypothetical protein
MLETYVTITIKKINKIYKQVLIDITSPMNLCTIASNKTF